MGLQIWIWGHNTRCFIQFDGNDMILTKHSVICKIFMKLFQSWYFRICWRFKSISRWYLWCRDWNFSTLFSKWCGPKPARNSTSFETFRYIFLFGSRPSSCWKQLDASNPKHFDKYFLAISSWKLSSQPSNWKTNSGL